MSDQTIFLHVKHRTALQGELIAQVDGMGLGSLMRLTANELMFLNDPRDPDLSIFTLAIDADRRDEVIETLSRTPYGFEVAFSDPPELELTPEQEAAALARLKARGFDFG